jgi:transcriptional regulator GlxA family with amidase domain
MPDSKRKVVLIAFDGMQLLDLAGPMDVFDAATRVLAGAGGYELLVATPEGKPVRAANGLEVGTGAGLAELPARGIDTLVVVGGAGTDAVAEDERFLGLLLRLAGAARRTCSVCGGAWALAAAGLLDGRRATTHWARCRRLAAAYPSVTVEPDRIYVRDGDVLTSAGVTAGIDLALALVEEDHGAEVARTVARWLVVFLQRPGGQSQFSERLGVSVGSQSPVRPLVDRIVAEPAANHSVAELARAAGLSERHLARVFLREARTTPARFVERVRVEAARDALEGGNTPVEAVAERCGFGSAETMRRAFMRVLGVNPGELRRRFQHVERTAA